MKFTPPDYAPPKANQRWFDAAMGKLATYNDSMCKLTRVYVLILEDVVRVRWIEDGLRIIVDFAIQYTQEDELELVPLTVTTTPGY